MSRRNVKRRRLSSAAFVSFGYELKSLAARVRAAAFFGTVIFFVGSTAAMLLATHIIAPAVAPAVLAVQHAIFIAVHPRNHFRIGLKELIEIDRRIAILIDALEAAHHALPLHLNALLRDAPLS